MMRRGSSILPVLVAVIAAWPTHATAQGLVGSATTVEGATLNGRLTMVEGGRATVTGAAGTTELDLAQLMTFETATRPSEVAAPFHVWLRSGLDLPAMQVVGGPATSGGTASLHVGLPSGLALDVPIGMVRAVRLGGREPAQFAAELRKPPSNEDLLFVDKDGTQHTSSVVVRGLTGDSLQFTLRGRQFDFALANVAAIVFGQNTGFAPDRQGQPRTTVALRTGEQLEGRVTAIDAAVHLRLDEGAELAVPAETVQSLGVVSDRLAWLAAMTPQVEQTPAFDRVWPWVRDGSAAGPGIVLGGKSHKHGVGMVPRTRLTFDLGGRYDLFEAVLGIDDRGGPQAHALFRVLVDGQVAFASEPLTLGAPPVPVRVELHRCQRLALEVDFGKNYDLGDYCVFADARVVQR